MHLMAPSMSLHGPVSIQFESLEMDAGIDFAEVALTAASRAVRERLITHGHYLTGTLDESLSEPHRTAEGWELRAHPDREGWLERESEHGSDWLDISDPEVDAAIDAALAQALDRLFA